MNERILLALKMHRSALHEGWAARLHAAPVTSPLAHPDTLVYLMKTTIDQVFHELAQPSARLRQPPVPRDMCRCGLNPLLSYFATAALSFQHTMAQSADDQAVSLHDLDIVDRAVTRVARREITIFCALCRHDLKTTPRVRECVHDKPSELHPPLSERPG
ncbi:hypothetical protein RAHE111665_13910 [Rariglobus hedericola]